MPAPSRSLAELTRRPLPALLLLGACALVHYLCHSLMLLPVLWNELRPAPPLRDLVLDAIPRNDWLWAKNYWLWLGGYLPLALLLFARDRARFTRFMLLGSALSLLRGLCIPLTGLGPPDGPDVNALRPFAFWPTYWSVVNPVSALVGHTANVVLTKDLFFSGHVGSTFLLALCSRGQGRWRLLYFAVPLGNVALVLVAHLHYTVDVVGAIAIAYMLWALGDRWLLRRWPALRAEDEGGAGAT